MSKKQKNYSTYLLLLIGSCIALYANSNEDQNVYLLIFGIVILMFGAYRLSATIPSKHEKEHDEDNFNV